MKTCPVRSLTEEIFVKISSFAIDILLCISLYVSIEDLFIINRLLTGLAINQIICYHIN
ncbi:MAG: hypothetical protein NT094_02700 [Candidatus Staskawiczbacteria bacterium]|nr:hypothetical protein [Candidatus Staskawiczbacteria bacterium]